MARCAVSQEVYSSLAASGMRDVSANQYTGRTALNGQHWVQKTVARHQPWVGIHWEVRSQQMRLRSSG